MREAESLHAIGSILQDRGHVDQAVRFFRRSLNAGESQASRLGGTEENRSGFWAHQRHYYLDCLDALLAQKQPERAIEVLERSRARSLLTMLAERDLVFAADLPAKIQRERQLNATEYDRAQAHIARLNPATDASGG
jgi:hypothetical protein